MPPLWRDWRDFFLLPLFIYFFFFHFFFNQPLCFEGTISEVKADPEEEPTPSNNIGAGEALLMNNGSRDTSHSDIQKLQQQLQDIKEQVRVPSASPFVMRRFNETNNLICVEERSPHRALYNYLSLSKNWNTFSRTVLPAFSSRVPRQL